MFKILKKHIFVIVGLSSLTLASCGEPNPDRFNTNDVSRSIGGHIFTLPQNYSMGKDNDVLSMTLLMPDLQARTRENEKFLDNPSYNKDIRIVLTSGDITNPSSQDFLMEDKNKKKLDGFLNDPTIKYKKPKKVDHHLTFYEALSGPDSITIHDLYVYTDKNDIEFILECPSKISKSTLGPLCISNSNVFGNLALKYWYPMEYLPHAFETHTKIQNLLISFHNRDKIK